jgi:hypothetical protein
MTLTNTDIYSDKYLFMLDLFCYYSSEKKLCNKLSYQKNGYCNECINFINNNKTKKEKFLEKKEIIVLSIKELLNKCEITSGKINKIKIVLEIYEIIYYNFFFNIMYPRFLIQIIKKIDEIICSNDNEHVNIYINENKDKEYIYNFILEMIKFVKDNNYDLSFDMDEKIYEKFLENFVNHMKKYYENIIDKNNNITNIDNFENNYIDIDNIEKYIICLDI